MSTRRDHRRFRRVIHSAPTTSDSRIDPPLFGLWRPVSQHPAEPPAPPSQHTPLVEPSSRPMQPKPAGHISLVTSHGTAHKLCEPSLAQLPEAQSLDCVHAAPSPFGSFGPAMHAVW